MAMQFIPGGISSDNMCLFHAIYMLLTQPRKENMNSKSSVILGYCFFLHMLKPTAAGESHVLRDCISHYVTEAVQHSKIPGFGMQGPSWLSWEEAVLSRTMGMLINSKYNSYLLLLTNLIIPVFKHAKLPALLIFCLIALPQNLAFHHNTLYASRTKTHMGEICTGQDQ